MGPRIPALGAAFSLGDVETALATLAFEDLTDRLNQLVTHYSSRLLIPTGRVKMAGYQVQMGLWKFTQYWNIGHGVEKRHCTDYVVGTLLPTMERVGLTVSGGWRVVVGPGPYIVAECSSARLDDITRAIEHDEFRQVTNRLIDTYVSDYHCRILAPAGRVDLPHFLKEMMAGF